MFVCVHMVLFERVCVCVCIHLGLCVHAFVCVSEREEKPYHLIPVFFLASVMVGSCSSSYCAVPNMPVVVNPY